MPILMLDSRIKEVWKQQRLQINCDGESFNHRKRMLEVNKHYYIHIFLNVFITFL